ncbi:DNA helicase II/ATP-dependent DNA helicase PcrA [Bathymodiolus japonicus methanotrophic gill symbiont]|uniref:DNA helicase II n=1 Tax=Bathymodiolus japonicus methanotrophic gill symbiont TaxID=113269 RepID=UPI001B666033|nr:DNA helicase II [Bathymodiolus japonicus methanotrophic gill symbiont]GFO73154.1 DNA helicase II/ATP-dependent DNA helicase PcrA [Bathymodiolus japonicus methanotrophic gill symbiont]
MDVTAIIDSLNDAQREAVSAPTRSMLVLAGAGSGKTRVLVHRIAWLIKIEHISPHNILAVTFTNKAAKEMRSRVEDLLNISARSMWIGTFHGLAHRLLRQHNKEAKLPDTFQVIDSDDQLRLIKRLMKAMNIDDNRWPPKQVVWYINAQKDEGIRAKHIQETGDLYQQQLLVIYRTYEDLCQRSGLVDFAELLLRAHETLRDNAELLAFYRARFKHVHVDEFQDTNTVQYAWLRLLTEGQDNLFVVGDDDQSIYGWRGAKIENMFNFQQHYPNHLLIRLEQNYRSTGNILKASNALIACNDGRMGKELRTDGGDGDLISLYSAFNEQDEAYFVVERIRKWVAEGNLRSDIAILYRSNAQSRQFEEKLMATGTPYRVYGGLRFFDRMEIKNALAYLFLMLHKDNDSAFERIINTPTRGVGAKTLDDIRQLARSKQISLWQAMIELLKAGHFTPRAENALKGFVQLINSLGEQAEDQELYEQVKYAIEKSGLIEFHKKEKGDKGEARVENLEELVNAARQFEFDEDNEENFSELDLFLAHAALESGDAQADDFEDCVQLMTLHSAKGLEFPLVFMVGLEEGLFPSQQSVDDIARLEEERRLCYVGMTRAMKLLYISYAESRRLYGKENHPRPSRFLKEIPAEQMQEIRLRASVSKPVSTNTKAKVILGTSGRYQLGQRVRHEKFGEGVVLQVDGEGSQERVQINFANVGMKWLMLSYAKLEVV